MFEELNIRIRLLIEELRGGYSGRKGQVLALIDDARSALQARFDTVGVWEQFSLAEAAEYANVDWLLAATFAVEKALFVSQLPEDEYWGGFCFARPHAHPSEGVAT
jgi:hypothetical protein